MPAPPAGKLQKDYDKLPVPQPQATSVRKREPKLLAVIDPGKCFGRGCEYCVAVCPVPDCISMIEVDHQALASSSRCSVLFIPPPRCAGAGCLRCCSRCRRVPGGLGVSRGAG